MLAQRIARHIKTQYIFFKLQHHLLGPRLHIRQALFVALIIAAETAVTKKVHLAAGRIRLH